MSDESSNLENLFKNFQAYIGGEDYFTDLDGLQWKAIHDAWANNIFGDSCQKNGILKATIGIPNVEFEFSKDVSHLRVITQTLSTSLGNSQDGIEIHKVFFRDDNQSAEQKDQICKSYMDGLWSSAPTKSNWTILREVIRSASIKQSIDILEEQKASLNIEDHFFDSLIKKLEKMDEPNNEDNTNE